MTDDSIADDIIRAGYERWKRLEEEKSAIGDDLKELFAELKGQGFAPKALRESFRRVRNINDASQQEHDAIVDLYVAALTGARPAHTREDDYSSDVTAEAVEQMRQKAAPAIEAMGETEVVSGFDPETGEIIDTNSSTAARKDVRQAPERKDALAGFGASASDKQIPEQPEAAHGLEPHPAGTQAPPVDTQLRAAPSFTAHADNQRPTVREPAQPHSTPDCPIGEEAGEAETGETLSASPANNSNQTAESAPVASPSTAGEDGNGLRSKGNATLAQPSVGVRDNGALAVAPGITQREDDASPPLPSDTIPPSAGSSPAVSDEGGVPSVSLVAANSDAAPADRTKPNPWCLDPEECGLSSWDHFCLRCQRVKAERHAVEAVQ